MEKRFSRLVSIIDKHYARLTGKSHAIPFALQYKHGPEHAFGKAPPAIVIRVHNPQAIAALGSMNQLAIIEAYLDGHLDLEGDLVQIMAMRDFFPDNKGFRYLWRFIRPFLFGQVKSDATWIAHHYDLEEDFFLHFLDRRHRAYSQAVFAHDDESLEDAETRKLEFAFAAVKAKPGDRVLDIGSGWGAVTQFAGRKGIQITSLTISKPSEEFVNKIIAEEKLPCRVIREHFFEHRPAERYDAIVNCGVTEHLPDYAASLRQYEKLLKPGGRLYLDASAAKIKHSHGSFLEKYVFEGNGTLLCLHDFLHAVAHSPFLLEGVWDDRHNYELTTRHWAENLDRAKDAIIARWGQKQYRIFQLYLWGCVEGFRSGKIEAYRLVLKLP